MVCIYTVNYLLFASGIVYLLMQAYRTATTIIRPKKHKYSLGLWHYPCIEGLIDGSRLTIGYEKGLLIVAENILICREEESITPIRSVKDSEWRMLVSTLSNLFSCYYSNRGAPAVEAKIRNVHMFLQTW